MNGRPTARSPMVVNGSIGPETNVIGVVIPTYNEVENIDPLVNGLLSRESLHVIFIDDGSTDGTQECIKEWENREPSRVFLLARDHKLGLATAYLTGFHYLMTNPSIRWIAQMDADGSHNVDDLFKMVAVGSTGYDLVVGSRYVDGGQTVNWARMRRWVSRAGSLYSSFLLQCSVNDMTGGFKLWDRDLLRNLPLEAVRSTGYGFQIEMNYLAMLAGACVTEVPITFRERIHGKSKMSWKIALEALIMVWRLRMHRMKLQGRIDQNARVINLRRT